MINPLPTKLADEIHLRDVDAVACNVEYANNLHPEGKYFAICDHVNNAIRLWLMNTMNEDDRSPSEATMIFMDFLNEAVFPSFFEMPNIKKITGGVNPIRLTSANSLEELVELMSATIESGNATKQ